MTSLFLIITTSAVCMDNFQGYIPDEGFVPDEKTAATIATIIWESMHGEPSRGEKYIINLEGNVWHIKGRFIRGKYSTEILSVTWFQMNRVQFPLLKPYGNQYMGNRYEKVNLM